MVCHRCIVVLASWAVLAAMGCGPGAVTRGGGKINLLPPDSSAGFVLERGRYDAVVTGSPNWLIERVELEPVKNGDDFVGFLLVRGVEADSDLATEGLKSGDIIQRVNGLPIGRPEEFMRVWRGLPTRDTLQIHFLREGRSYEVTWLIR